MSPAILALVLSAGSVRVEPPALTFGPAAAPLEFVAPGATAVRVWCGNCDDGGGAISAAEPNGPGRFRARFTFPNERFPRVVLLAVEERSGSGERQLDWVALPLLANATLRIETKPRAQVTVSIGSRTFGPRPANAQGRLALPVVVPPGYPSASVVAADRAGNTTTTSLDLAARPYPRAAAALPGGEVIADQSAQLEVFAVEADGAPLANAALLRVAARLGSVKAAEARPGGVFVVGYRGPKSIEGGPDTLSVAVEGTPATRLTVQVRPGAPARIAVTFSSREFVAGSGQRIAVVATVTDANGNALPGLKTTITSEFGVAEPTAEGAQLSLPDAFDGRREVRVRAAAPGIGGEAALALRPGPPASAELAMPARVAAGEPVQGTLRVKDAWGNPVDATTVGVASVEGRQAVVTAAPQGYSVAYQTGPEQPAGPLELEVRAADRTLTRTKLTVLPYQRAWAVIAGAFVAGSWNLNQARAVSPRLALGLRLGRSPFEVGAEGAFTWFPHLSAARTTDAPNTAEVDMSAWSAALAVRCTLQPAVRWSLQLFAAAGAQRTASAVTASGRAALVESRWGPMVRGGGGAALHAMGGRLLVQLEYGYAPLGQGTVRGNSLGAGVAAGYLAAF